MNVVTLRPPGPPKPKFQRTIGDDPDDKAVVVTIEDDGCGLITIEIKDDEPTSWDKLFPSEARELAAALIKAADKADRIWDRKCARANRQ